MSGVCTRGGSAYRLVVNCVVSRARGSTLQRTVASVRMSTEKLGSGGGTPLAENPISSWRLDLNSKMDILVLDGSKDTLSKIREVVLKDRYVVYPISNPSLVGSAWVKSCRLLVLSEEPSPDVEPVLAEFSSSGGNILRLKDQTRENLLESLKTLKIELKTEKMEDFTPGITEKIVPKLCVGSFLAVGSSHDHLFNSPQIQSRMLNRSIHQGGVELRFSDKAEEDVSESCLYLRPCTDCDNFNFAEYSSHLSARDLGRFVFHFPLMSSTRVVLEGSPLLHGLAVIADQQTAGKGRDKNEWLSPLGCAMFSLQIHLNSKSNLGQRPSLIQHMVGVAVVQAIRHYAPDLEMRLKWPNDIYYTDQKKMGGILVSASFQGSNMVINIGVGLNLSNENPKVSVNQLLRNSAAPLSISREQYLAQVFSRLEKLIDQFQTGNMENMFQEYYRYWLHENQEVTVKTQDGSVKGRIVRLDEYGFLRVRTSEGEEMPVDADGNSFDMMNGLIHRKFS